MACWLVGESVSFILRRPVEWCGGGRPLAARAPGSPARSFRRWSAAGERAPPAYSLAGWLARLAGAAVAVYVCLAGLLVGWLAGWLGWVGLLLLFTSGWLPGWLLPPPLRTDISRFPGGCAFVAPAVVVVNTSALLIVLCVVPFVLFPCLPPLRLPCRGAHVGAGRLPDWLPGWLLLPPVAAAATGH